MADVHPSTRRRSVRVGPAGRLFPQRFHRAALRPARPRRNGGIASRSRRRSLRRSRRVPRSARRAEHACGGVVDWRNGRAAVRGGPPLPRRFVDGATARAARSRKPRRFRRARGVSAQRRMAALWIRRSNGWLSADFQTAHPEVVEQIRDMHVIRNRRVSLACEAVRDFDVRSKLASIRCPTLVVAGERDTGTPTAAAQVIADAVAGAQFEILDAAHLSPIEQSHRFTALLETFLQAV